MRRTLMLLLAVAAALVAVSSVAADSTQRCKPTPEDAAGPFTQASPPLRARIGTGHVLTGVVLSVLDCEPIRGARVEFRQANRRGVYTRAGSGAVLTNAAGRFRFEGPRPVSYEGRPAHIHIRVFAANHELLLTRYEPRGRRSGSVRLVLRPQQVARPLSAPRQISIEALSMNVPTGWRWRTLGGPDPGTHIVQLSNAHLAVRSGVDPIKNMAKRTFVLTFVPLGSFGSVRRPRIERTDFVPRAEPSRPRGHAVARSFFCSSGGRCFSIRLEYGSERVPSATLAIVNRLLRTVRAAPVSR